MAVGSIEHAPRGGKIRIHPLLVRLTHWVNAFAMVCMIMSGWKIYDASRSEERRVGKEC